MTKRTRSADGTTLFVEGAIEDVVTEEPEHREGVFNGTGDTYEARCSCGWTDGPHPTPGEARSASDHHVGRFSTLEEAQGAHAAVEFRLAEEAELRRIEQEEREAAEAAEALALEES